MSVTPASTPVVVGTTTRVNRLLQPQDGFVAVDPKDGTVITGQAPGARIADSIFQKLKAPFDRLTQGQSASHVQFVTGANELTPVAGANGTAVLSPDDLQQVAAQVNPQSGGLVSLLATNADHGSTRTHVLVLPKDYDGPIFVSTVKNTLCEKDREGPNAVIEGSQKLLQAVADQHVPIIYVDGDSDKPTTREVLDQMPDGILVGDGQHAAATVLKQLQTTYPSAHIFALGNDKGQDPADFASLGAHCYVHCDDATQRHVPAGFQGVVADDYTNELQTRILGDMGAGENVANLDALQPVPVIPRQTFLEKMEDMLPLVKGAAGMYADKIAAHFHRQGDGLKEVARHSEVGLQAASNDQLTAMAENLLRHTPGKAAEAGADFLKVITAHGDDAGHVDAILERLPKVDERVKAFDKQTQAAYAALRAKNQAVPGDWNAFDRYVDAATGTKRVPGTVEPLINGQRAFPLMLADIDKAQKSISMTMFAVQSDEAGWEFAKHLAAASDPAYAAELAKTDPTFADRAKMNRHVAVRVLYDDFGSSRSNGQPTDPKIYQFLRDHGVEVAAHPPGPLGNHLDHRKIMVLDGTTGYIGGMNVGNEYRDLWHDVMSRVTGPAVGDMQRLCNQQFKQFVGPIPADQEAAMFPKLEAPVNGQPTRIISHIGHQDRNIKMTYLRAIQTATQRICIADPYFSDPDIIAALEAAAKRGVQVDVVLPKFNNHKLEGAASRHDYAKLQAAGVHVYEYYGRIMAHDKVAIFDDHLATIGSSNLDMRSDWDDEANVWVEDPSVVDNLYRNLFLKDISQSDNMASYKPGLGARLYNEAGSLLRNQL